MCLTGVPEGKPEVILQTGCRDCVVIYINNYDHGFPYLMLLSKRRWWLNGDGEINIAMRWSFPTQVEDRPCRRQNWLSSTPRRSVWVGLNPLSTAQITVMEMMHPSGQKKWNTGVKNYSIWNVMFACLSFTDYGNCQGFDEDSTVNFFRLSPVMIQRLTRNYQGILECISDSFNSYTSLLLNVVKQLSGSLWSYASDKQRDICWIKYIRKWCCILNCVY